MIASVDEVIVIPSPAISVFKFAVVPVTSLKIPSPEPTLAIVSIDPVALLVITISSVLFVIVIPVPPINVLKLIVLDVLSLNIVPLPPPTFAPVLNSVFSAYVFDSAVN